MLTSATKKTTQWLIAKLVWVAGSGLVTSKRSKHATNFSFKLLNDFIEVRGLSLDI